MLLCKAILQLPPPINQTYKAVYSSRLKRTVFFSSYPAKKWKKESQEILNLYPSKTLFEGDVKLLVRWYFKNKRRDIDSGLKLLMDCLQGTIIKNDNQIKSLKVHKEVSKEDPRVLIKLYSI